MQLLRVVLVWLLVVAMPVQGAAAAVMASCGPSGSPRLAAWVSAQADASPSGETVAHVNHAAGHDHPGHHDHHAAVNGGDDHTPDHSAHGAQKKCSACASCCSMNALPNPASALLVPDFAPPEFDCEVPRIVAFAAEGPERPPRSRLA